jgi:hypothetical protein
MDFSIVLVLPFAAIVAFATLLGAAAAKRARPRLAWPFAFSTFAAALVFLQRPEVSMLGYWILAFIILGLWAAVGTVIGAMAARMILAAANSLRRR